MHMRHDSWVELVNDEENGGCLVPMLMLYHEHDEDPTMRPDPISPEQREKVKMHMSAGLFGAYQYFRQELSSASSKVGRNALCPCGSGKKYKKCCGGMRVQ
jgi:uncharacterized protein